MLCRATVGTNQSFLPGRIHEELPEMLHEICHPVQYILKSSMRSRIGGRAEISGGKRQDITYSCVVTLWETQYMYFVNVKDVKALEKMFF